jgi:hypothetical protein
VGGIASPNPEYPQPIQTVTGEQTVSITGKNLFNKNNVVKGIPQPTDGSIGQTYGSGRTCEFIPVLPDTQYTHSGHSLGWAVVACYRADKSFIRRFDDVSTITTPSDCAYVSVSCNVSNLGTCQFEYGSTATTYEAYHSSNYPIDLGSIELCKLSTYQDYIYKDGDTWKVHKAINKVDVSALTGWYASGTHTIKGTWAGLNIQGLVADTGYSGHFTRAYANALYNGTTPIGFAVGSDGLYFSNNDWTLAQFTAFIGNNPVVLYGALSTTPDTVITDQTLIAQLEAIRTAALENGANTITNAATGSNLAGDMEISYYGYNPTNRYDKFIWLDLNNNYEKIGE